MGLLSSSAFLYLYGSPGSVASQGGRNRDVERVRHLLLILVAADGREKSSSAVLITVEIGYWAITSVVSLHLLKVSSFFLSTDYASLLFLIFFRPHEL